MCTPGGGFTQTMRQQPKTAQLVACVECTGVADCVDGLQSLYVTNVALLHKLIAEGFSEQDCAEVGIVGASRQALMQWHERTYVPPTEDTSGALYCSEAPQPEPDAIIYTADDAAQGSTTTVTTVTTGTGSGATNRGAADEEEAVDLLTCLERFGRLEQLEGDSKYYCPKCKEFMDGTKQVGVWQPPAILVLQLKRFKHQQRFGGTGAFSAKKVETLVKFSANELLDVTPFVLSSGSQSEQEVKPEPEADMEAGAQEPEAEPAPEPEPLSAEAQALTDQIEKLSSELDGTQATKLMLEEMGEDVSSLETEIRMLTDKLSELRAELEVLQIGVRHLYELFAIANHTGGTGGGHYCACDPKPCRAASHSRFSPYVMLQLHHLRPSCSDVTALLLPSLCFLHSIDQ